MPMVTEFSPSFHVIGTCEGVRYIQAVPKLAHSLHVWGLASCAEGEAYSASPPDGRVLPLWGLPDLLPTERIFSRRLTAAPEARPFLPCPIDSATPIPYNDGVMRSARLSISVIVFLTVPWLVGAPQDCSVQSYYAHGQCPVAFILSFHVHDNIEQNELIALAALQKPPRISQVVPTPPLLVGISYLTIQRLMLAPPSEESLEPQAMWDFGRVAQLEARLRNIDALIRALLAKLAQDPTPVNQEITLVVSIDSLGPFLPAEIETFSSFVLDERLHLALSRATITLRTALGLGSLIGQLEFDPKDLEISKEKIGLELALGQASLLGITTFEHGLGLTSQVYALRARMGNVELVGQAVFTSTSQEFTIGVSIAGLALSGSSLITPSGLTQSVFIQIPIVVSPPKK